MKTKFKDKLDALSNNFSKIDATSGAALSNIDAMS